MTYVRFVSKQPGAGGGGGAEMEDWSELTIVEGFKIIIFFYLVYIWTSLSLTFVLIVRQPSRQILAFQSPILPVAV